MMDLSRRIYFFAQHFFIIIFCLSVFYAIRCGAILIFLMILFLQAYR